MKMQNYEASRFFDDSDTGVLRKIVRRGFLGREQMRIQLCKG
jgi:hypothetical protein